MDDQKSVEHGGPETDGPDGNSSAMGFTLLMGVAFGTAVGAATGEMGLWLSLGAALGLLAGGCSTRARKRGRKEKESLHD